MYTLSGELLYKTGGCGDEVGKFKGPYISDLDSTGRWLLVCDWDNSRLQVYDTQNREWCVVSGLVGVKYPRCAGVGDIHIWVGMAYYPEKKLFKLEAV